VLHTSAIETLRRWISPDDAQEKLRLEYLEHLQAHADATWRSCTFGHLTGSAIVVNAERTAVALLFHPRVGRWLQAGGHCEADDASLMAVALREATEEFGVAGLVISPQPIDLDIHAYACPKGTPNRHLDVRFRCVAPDGAELVCSDESFEVRWFPYDALPDGLDESTKRLIAGSRI
jgi:8-oxo-dGTP pyrophosphatase MutT (NUDIX family)